MQIKVCGLPYEVTIVDDWMKVSHQKEGTLLYGEISYRDESIRIDGSKSEEMINTTFFHEILHAIIEHSAIRELKDENGEHLENPINQLALGLFGVLDSIGIRLIKKDDESC